MVLGRVSQRVCAACQRGCSCNHPSVHAWLGPRISVEHLPRGRMFKRIRGYGSDNNALRATGLMFVKKGFCGPHTVFPFDRSKILNSLQYSTACFSWFWGKGVASTLSASPSMGSTQHLCPQVSKVCHVLNPEEHLRGSSLSTSWFCDGRFLRLSAPQ